MSEHRNLLVLGAPRSGTTLLSAMLGCHPDVGMLNEELTGAFTRVLAKRYRGVKLCPPHQIELHHSATMRARDFVRAQARKAAAPLRRLAGRPPKPGGFYKAHHSIQDILAMPEDLRVIGIIRSPEAVISSIIRRGRQDEATARYRWQRLIEILDHLSARQSPRFKMAVVRFDDLVADPEALLANLLEWLDLSFDAQVLEGFKHTPQYRGRTKIEAERAGSGLDGDLRQSPLRESAALAAAYRRLHASAVGAGKR